MDDVYLFGEVMDDLRFYFFGVFYGVMNYFLYDFFLRFFVFGEIGVIEFINGIELLSVYFGLVEYFIYNFFDNYDMERFIDLVGKERYFCVFMFLMMYKGILVIFYGDEIGLRGLGEGMLVGRILMFWDEEKWDF